MNHSSNMHARGNGYRALVMGVSGQFLAYDDERLPW